MPGDPYVSGEISRWQIGKSRSDCGGSVQPHATRNRREEPTQPPKPCGKPATRLPGDCFTLINWPLRSDIALSLHHEPEGESGNLPAVQLLVYSVPELLEYYSDCSLLPACDPSLIHSSFACSTNVLFSLLDNPEGVGPKIARH